MKILFQNFCYGSGNRGNVKDYVFRPHHFIAPPKGPLNAFTALLSAYKPDVVAVSELDLGSFRTRKRDPITALRRLGYGHVVAAQKYKPRGVLAHTPLFNMQGNGFLSQASPSYSQLHYLSHGTKRLVIEAHFNDHTVFLIHLSLRRQTRLKQLDELRVLIKGRPRTIVMGDFNTLSHPEDIEMFCADSDLRSLNTRRQFTYPSLHPRLELDYILTSADVSITNFEILSSEIADHLPLLLEIE